MAARRASRRPGAARGAGLCAGRKVGCSPRTPFQGDHHVLFQPSLSRVGARLAGQNCKLMGMAGVSRRQAIGTYYRQFKGRYIGLECPLVYQLGRYNP